MKILFIAPLPPPINGQSKASKVVLDAISSGETHEVKVIDFKKKVIGGRFATLYRFLELWIVFLKVLRFSRWPDVVYVSLSESISGNLKDILLFSLLQHKKVKIIGHMLGGAGMKNILSANNLITALNTYFLGKFEALIVESKQNKDMFQKHMSAERIFIISNFVEDYIFETKENIFSKFTKIDPIEVLFLSNMRHGKGYNELIDSFINLEVNTKKKFKLKFVGGFAEKKDKDLFLSKVNSDDRIEYLGDFIDGKQKKDLFSKTHVFALPTYYPFEGLPISILEAYASGCVIISTYHSGIPSVFQDDLNGFVVEKKSIASLDGAYYRILNNKDRLIEMAMYNFLFAEKNLKLDNFQSGVLEVFKFNN